VHLNFERGSIDDWREKVRKRPGSILAARGLARAIVNTVDPQRATASEIDALLAEVRKLRLRFAEDEEIAHSHAMALANSAEDAISEKILVRNGRLLDELRTVVSSVEWNDYSVIGFSITIMAAQYVGLLKQARYDDATRQLDEMSSVAFGGSHLERLEWLIAVRNGFWVLLSQGESRRVNDQIGLMRDFRRRHPGDDYEAPHALLAMLLGAFEHAELRGDTALADARFEEACSLGGVADDHYGHVARLHHCLSHGMLSEPARGFVLAERLASIWKILSSESRPN
jgi:predicted RNA-binding protein YlqC (UPF0109 family)